MLQFGVWQIAVRHFLPKLFTVDYLKCVLLNCSLASHSGHKDRAIYQLLKILTVMTRAHDGHAEYCLNWNVYDINVNCGFFTLKSQLD